MEVKLNLIGLNGNAFVLLAEFRKAALKQGYSEESVNEVIEDAKSGDYDHLLNVLLKHTIAY